MATFFISYTRGGRDESLATELHAALESLGHDVFLDSNIDPGEDWAHEIERGIRGADTVLVLLSEASVISDMVTAEVQLAKERRKAHGSPRIVPIHLDPDIDLGYAMLAWLGRLQYIEAYPPTTGETLATRVHAAATEGAPGDVQDAAHHQTLPSSTPTRPLKTPRFHYGGVVPPEYFIGRVSEISRAQGILRSGQSFLLVGNRRAGKTSFCKKLIRDLMDDSRNEILAAYVNLQQCPNLTINSFLEHVLLGLIGEIARIAFGRKYTQVWLSESDSDSQQRDGFEEFQSIAKHIRGIHFDSASKRRPPIGHEEFVGIMRDLLSVIQPRSWQRFLVILDEANRFSANLSADLLVSNEEVLQDSGVLAVYAASPQAVDSYSRLRDALGYRIHLGSFDRRDDLRDLIQIYYRDVEPTQASIPVSENALDQIWRLTRGSPFLIQLLSGRSFDTARSNHSSSVRDRHVAQAWKGMTNELGAEVIEAILE